MQGRNSMTHLFRNFFGDITETDTPWPRTIRKIVLNTTVVAATELLLLFICFEMTESQPSQKRLVMVATFVVAMLLIPCVTTVVITRRMRQLRQLLVRNGGRLCLNCEHPLHVSLRVGKCSECGSNYDIREVRRSWRRVKWRRLGVLQHLRRGKYRTAHTGQYEALIK